MFWCFLLLWIRPWAWVTNNRVIELAAALRCLFGEEGKEDRRSKSVS